MFLSKENHIRWRLLTFATIVVCAFVLASIFYLDAPFADFAIKFNWIGWKYLGGIFCAKNWLVMSFLAVVIFYARKILRSHEKIGIKEFVLKIKGGNAFFVFCSVFCSACVVGIAKIMFGRARPVAEMGPDVFMPMTNDWLFNSMPSGHTAITFAGLVMIGLLAPRAKWFTWTLAIIIGASRLFVGVHWLSDVVLGAFIGMVCADFVKYILVRRFK